MNPASPFTWITFVTFAGQLWEINPLDFYQIVKIKFTVKKNIERSKTFRFISLILQKTVSILIFCENVTKSNFLGRKTETYQTIRRLGSSAASSAEEMTTFTRFGTETSSTVTLCRTVGLGELLTVLRSFAPTSSLQNIISC